ncbi:MAG: hypothetical protein LBL71_02770 [Endomicrobium sp.]|jgi:hypothetical protein|nr:hypothetical protein [Endomicrobium sp.]
MIKNVIALMLVLSLAVPANADRRFWKKKPPPEPVVITKTSCIVVCAVVGVCCITAGLLAGKVLFKSAVRSDILNEINIFLMKSNVCMEYNPDTAEYSLVAVQVGNSNKTHPVLERDLKDLSASYFIPQAN